MPARRDPLAPARIGRPPKPEAERRGQTMGVRLSPVDRATIQARAARAQLTPAEYVRRQALGAPPPVVVPEVNRAAWVELGKLAGNLNQLMRRLHLGHVATVQPADVAMVARVETQVQALRRALLGQPEPATTPATIPEAAP